MHQRDSILLLSQGVTNIQIIEYNSKILDTNTYLYHIYIIFLIEYIRIFICIEINLYVTLCSVHNVQPKYLSVRQCWVGTVGSVWPKEGGKVILVIHRFVAKASPHSTQGFCHRHYFQENLTDMFGFCGKVFSNQTWI